MRLIDGNKIVMSLADWWYSSFGQEETEESKAIKKVMELVEKMVMEMPEIVRCKDCKHRTMTGWSRYEEGMYRYVYNCDKGIIYDIKDSDFCSYGEKLQLSRETSTNAKDICEQIKKHAERIKAEADKNPDSLWSKGMKSFDGWEMQVTSKLNNLDDFLLREKSKDCKEQKSKLESEQMREYIPKDEVLDIIKSMPRDLVEEYVYELDGIWLDDDEEKLQLSPETSTNGTYIRDGRLMHDLVYRGEAEATDTDLISRQAAIEAMWKALYTYEDLTEKQFMEHEELELKDWFQHRIFVQRMHEECMKSIESLPPVEPKPVYEDPDESLACDDEDESEGE